MTQGDWRLKVARWLAPTADDVPADVIHLAAPPDTAVKDAWVEVCEQFALRMLVLAEQLRPTLDRLEGNEDDPDRLQWLYHVDHGVSRMRRAARELRVLAGCEPEEMAGHSSSLLDVIRAAASAIEHYDRVSVGPVVELGVLAYAADDIASLLAVLADNGARYSPSVVRVSAHLLGDGGVMVRIEDSGIGIDPDRLATVNATMAGPPPEVGAYTGRHTGFPVAHRLACKHGLGVRLACRPVGRGTAGGVSGTVAMVTIPAQLVCEIPELALPEPTHPRDSRASNRGAPRHLNTHKSPPAWPVPAGDVVANQPELPVARDGLVTSNGLPRRQPGSTRNAKVGGPSLLPDRKGTPDLRSTPDLGSTADLRSTADPAAAGESFAADVAAFTAGSPGSELSATSGAGDERRAEPEGRML